MSLRYVVRTGVFSEFTQVRGSDDVTQVSGSYRCV